MSSVQVRKNGTSGGKSTRPPTTLELDEDVPPATAFRRALPQFLAVGVKNLLLFGYGMTLGFPTIVIPAIQGGEGRDPHSDIVLNRDEISWFSSINLLCVPLGCIFSGIFTQPIGKRRAMQLVNIPILVAWLLFHFATNIYHLYAGLCLVGLMGGLMEAPVLTYVAEITDPKYRGILAATGSTCVICGVFMQFVLGTFLKWRTIAAISTVFPVISITALFFVPESPHWLVAKGRYMDAQRALAWLRGWVPISHIQEEYAQIYEMNVKSPALSTSAMDQKHISSPSSLCCSSDTIRPYGRRSFLLPYALITLTFFIGHFSGKTTLQTYAVQIFHTLKAPIDKYYATVLLGAVEIVGTLVCVVLVHFTGKRPLVLISTLGCGLCFLGTATYARFLDVVPGGGVDNVVSNVSDVSAMDLIGARNGMLKGLHNMSGDVIGMDERNMMMQLIGSGDMFENNDTMVGSFLDDNMMIMSGNANESVIPLHNFPPAVPIPEDILLRIPDAEKNRFVWLPLLLLLMSALFAHMGIKLIPWMLIGEVFPAAVRSGASGISGGTGYVFGFLANKLFLSMLNTMTLPGTFWFYSAVAITGSVVLYFVLPETEGRTLMEIERHFSGEMSLSAVANHSVVGNNNNAKDWKIGNSQPRKSVEWVETRTEITRL